MADLASTTSGVTKLNKSNYNVWSSRIKSYLEGQDLWEVVGGDDTVQPGDVEELKKWKVKAGKVMYVLKTTISDEMLDLIEGAKTPKEAWGAFVALFSKKHDVQQQRVIEHPPRYPEAISEEGFTHRESSAKDHEKLRAKSEKWLKKAAQGGMVVAALITTVAFNASITVPGGNKRDTGFPVFRHSASFLIFAISDVLSLVYSSASMMAFLSIFTSQHAQEEFLLMSQLKLNIGLGALLTSITTMMIMFSATFFTFFKDGMLWIPILVTVFSSVPVFYFHSLHPRLSTHTLGTAVQLLSKRSPERGGSR